MANTNQANRKMVPRSAAGQRSTVVRMNLFVLVRILFQYLGRVEPTSLDLAKEVLKDCERKHNTKDSKYETLADAISERVRDAVGESHWAQARKIQKQLVINQQRKKLKALKAQGQKKQPAHKKSLLSRMSQASSSSSSQQRNNSMTMSSLSQPLPPQHQASSSDMEAIEAAKTMSALSTSAASSTSTSAPFTASPPDRSGASTPTRSNYSGDFNVRASNNTNGTNMDEEMQGGV